MNALEDIAAERRRQVEEEGWSCSSDDNCTADELSRAAASYCIADINRSHAIEWWPWLISWFKPTDRRRSLVKAGALIIAEIERLDRAAEKQE